MDAAQNRRFGRFLWFSCGMFASLGFWVMVADVPSADLYGKILAVFGGMYGGLGLILHDRDMTR